MRAASLSVFNNLNYHNRVQMEASCVTMSVQEELQGDLINRISSRSIFFSATWFLDEIECENPTLFGYDVFYGYYSSSKNCGKRDKIQQFNHQLITITNYDHRIFVQHHDLLGVF